MTELSDYKRLMEAPRIARFEARLAKLSAELRRVAADRADIGFGIGIEPFRWRRFGLYTIEGVRSRWFNLGPIFIQWRWPSSRS